jgi:hypothetical protein
MFIGIDLLVYRDLTDPIHEKLPSVGDDAAEWLGEEFRGMYVVAVGPPIHEGKDATVVLGAEYRPELAQGLKRFVDREPAS